MVYNHNIIKILLKNIMNKEINYKDFLKVNNLFRFNHAILPIKKFKIIDNFDIDIIWPSEFVEYRNNWLKIIDKYSNIEECLMHAKSHFRERYGEEWFTRYHNLFYSIKKNGYDKNIIKTNYAEYPVGVRFPDNTIYRVDGTHRCSVMKYLGYTGVTIKIFEIEDVIKEIPEIKDLIDDYIKN